MEGFPFVRAQILHLLSASFLPLFPHSIVGHIQTKSTVIQYCQGRAQSFLREKSYLYIRSVFALENPWLYSRGRLALEAISPVFASLTMEHWLFLPFLLGKKKTFAPSPISCRPVRTLEPWDNPIVPVHSLHLPR